MPGGAVFAWVSASAEGEALDSDRVDSVRSPVPARLCTSVSFLSGNLCLAQLPPPPGSPA